MSINLKTNFEQLLTIIKQEKFSSNYPSYDLSFSKLGYLIIPKKKNNEIKIDNLDNLKNIIFLFKQKINIKFIEDDSIDEIKAFSSLQIEEYASSHNIQISQLFIYVGKRQEPYTEMKKSLGALIKNQNLEIYIKLIEELPELVHKEVLSENIDYTPEEYSPFFYDYFIYEDKNKKLINLFMKIIKFVKKLKQIL